MEKLALVALGLLVPQGATKVPNCPAPVHEFVLLSNIQSRRRHLLIETEESVGNWERLFQFPLPPGLLRHYHHSTGTS